LHQPDWAARHSNTIEAAAAAATYPAVGTDPSGIAAQHITCPGFHPIQLAFLALEYTTCVLGLDLGDVAPSLMGLSFMSLMLKCASKQVALGLCSLEPAAQQAYAEGCVEYVWSGLGKQLQRAAGVAEAELEGDGSQPAAAADGDSISKGVVILDGVRVELPADDCERLRMLWEEYSGCLFSATVLYAGERHCCLHTTLFISMAHNRVSQTYDHCVVASATRLRPALV
jgi:hypothetical protein